MRHENTHTHFERRSYTIDSLVRSRDDFTSQQMISSSTASCGRPHTHKKTVPWLSSSRSERHVFTAPLPTDPNPTSIIGEGEGGFLTPFWTKHSEVSVRLFVFCTTRRGLVDIEPSMFLGHWILQLWICTPFYVSVLCLERALNIVRRQTDQSE